ncbi:hypothetical protein ES708_33732 [subsurface metagenome]
MNCRVVYIKGSISDLPYGDPEKGDRRFVFKDDSGDEIISALPVLLSEGWIVDSITNLGSPHNLAIATLKKNDED